MSGEWWLFFSWLCLPFLLQAQLDNPQLKQRIDHVIQTQMQQQRIPGLALAVLVDGEPFYIRGYGKANLENGAPVTVETLFGIGSCSKALTAFAIMLLVDEGKVHVNDSIKRYIRDAPESWGPVTVRQLLSHTSGIPQHQGPHIPWSKTWHQLAARPFQFAPGSQTKYNNFGYKVLSRLIEVVSGQKYGHFMHERVFKPLGMVHTSLPEQLYPPGLAVGYKTHGHQIRLAHHQHPWRQMWGSGGIVTNILNFARWDQALTRQELLSPQTYRLMWAPVLLNNGKPSGWCLGWQIRQQDGITKYSKDGGIIGYRSQIIRQVTDRISLIFLTNTSPVKFGKMARPLFRLMQNALHAEQKEEEQDDDIDDEQVDGIDEDDT